MSGVAVTGRRSSRHFSASRIPAALGRGIRDASPTLHFWLIAVALAGALLAIRVGSGPIPVNDDWSYIKSALVLHASHHIRLEGFGQMFLVGQLYLAQPFIWLFGSRVVAFDVFGVVCTVVWLWLVFVLTRPLVGGRRALLLIAVVGAWPALGLLSTSFMTDVPFATLSWAGLYFGIKAFETRRALLLLPAFASTFVAFTIREQAITVLGALAIFAAIDPRPARRVRRWAIGGAVGVLACCYALEQMRRGLPNADVAPFGLGKANVVAGMASSVRGLFSIGLALSPLALRLVLGSGGPLRAPFRVQLGRACALAAGLVLLLAPPHALLLGNLVSRYGGYANAVVGVAPPVFGALVWALVEALAVVSTVIIGGEIAGRARRLRVLGTGRAERRPRQTILTTQLLLLAGMCAALGLLGERQYDRYLLPILPLGGLLLLRPVTEAGQEEVRARGRFAVVLVTTAFVYLISLCLTASTYVRDHAVWAAAAALTRNGVAPTAINAGSDWNGLHATTAVERRPPVEDNRQYAGDMWIRRFPRSSDCYLVTVSAMPGARWRLLHTSSAGPYGAGLGNVTVYVYRRTDHRPLGPGRC